MTRRPEHNHPEYWRIEAQYRFDDRMHKELEALEHAVDKLTTRITLMLGGLTLIAVLLPVIAPFIRLWLDIPVNQ
jgi:hypothetical protein